MKLTELERNQNHKRAGASCRLFCVLSRECNESNTDDDITIHARDRRAKAIFRINYRLMFVKHQL